jgi:hypothetical protein
MMIVERDAKLLEIVRALHAAGRLARGLHGGQEQGNQDTDDGDYHQQFNERETGSSRHGVLPRSIRRPPVPLSRYR